MRSGRLLLGGAILIAVAASCAAPLTVSSGGETPSPAASDPGDQRLDEGGNVAVAVSWVAGTSTAKVWMNTHSVDLDGFDLAALARVRLDGGTWVAPTAWDAAPGGHHRSGTLTFGSLDPAALAAARLVELEIRDVAVPTRLLRWERPG